MVWYKNILIVACESIQLKTYEVKKEKKKEKEGDEKLISRE
jgi:hypothetical protein